MTPFEEDLAYGEYGERIAWISLLESARTRQVLDVRKDKYFQERDIDFLQLDVNNKVNKIEVKTDRQAHTSGNIVFETKSNSNEGCLARSEADYVYYYIEKSGELVGIKLRKLKELINANILRLREVPMGDNARGYLIAIEDLERYKVAERRKVWRNAECSQKR